MRRGFKFQGWRGDLIAPCIKFLSLNFPSNIREWNLNLRFQVLNPFMLAKQPLRQRKDKTRT